MSDHACKTLKFLYAENSRGRNEALGAIAKKKRIGDVDVYLTFTEQPSMWWIITCERGRLRKLGYVLARREDCWRHFESIDAAGLAELHAKLGVS